jgi:hypothetical protein
MRLTVATHGHCFDGMASAALFTVLARKVYGEVGVRYRACTYGPGIDGVPPNWLDGEQNAVLDYRYGPRERLGWYFDHHITAFATPEIERTALAEADETLATPFVADAKKRLYFDPTYGSCTKLVADVAKARFGLVLPPHLEELVRVADIIDAARYESAADAIRIDTPAAVLAAVVEPRGNTTFLHAVIPSLIDEGLEAAVALPRVQALWEPLAAGRRLFEERVRERAVLHGPVVLVDMGDLLTEVAAKFHTYAQYPTSMYSVTLLRTAQQLKIGVGYNPWCGAARRHDVSALCKRYGGGGHPVVGGASMPLAELERARAIVRELTEELGR